MLALGFTPSFYNFFTESIIEVKIAITMAISSEFKLGVKAKAGWSQFSTSVNASYSRKNDYKIECSNLLRTKLVPVPAPAGLQAYVDALIKARSAAVETAIPWPHGT